MSTVICSLPCTHWFCQTLRFPAAVVTDDVEGLLPRAIGLGASGAAARKAGDEWAADGFFREALDAARTALQRLDDRHSPATRLDVLRAGICFALDCGRVEEAQTFLAQVAAVEPAAGAAEDWAPLRDVDAWPDEWLVAAVRRDPPVESALDALAERYWKPLFARCQFLTLDRNKAHDLAQEAWCRVLRARHALRPGGNFPAYLTAVATNIWRDWHRSARRAGGMAEHRLASLDAEVACDDGGTRSCLGDAMPDLNSIAAAEQRLLMLDVDHALAQLSPLLREILVSRFLAEESCAEIGRRHGRSEQTISGWVRQGIRELKHYLAEPQRCTSPRIAAR
ncbi:MAG TPA: sigma-70 family RNA polymerase sigma factor [Opitutaceae bacterium]